MKTIIHIWKQTVTNFPLESFWGIGDMLRGTYGLYLLCKKNGYKLIVDISLHPISQFLVHEPHEYSDIVMNYKDNIQFVLDYIIEEYCNKVFSISDVAIFATNCNLDVYNTPPTEDLKDFIKKFLTPTPYFKEYFDKMYNTIPHIPFNIIHMRLGDLELTGKKIDTEYDTFYKYIEDVPYNSILLSDSTYFKEYVESKDTNIFMFHTRMVHLGYTTDPIGIRDTLFEFLLLTRASSIKSYSVYSWKSGFVTIANIIFDVPLHDLKANTLPVLN
jgi:hypothetical protein